jgi:hypothetical protein
MKIKENNTIAFNLIQYWKDGHYSDDCQYFAKLQCLISEALDNKEQQQEDADV